MLEPFVRMRVGALIDSFGGDQRYEVQKQSGTVRSCQLD